MKVIETGQDWKIAALRSSFHVHFFFFGGIMNKKYMDLAFFYAEKAYNLDEVPIGAVIVKDDKVISYGYNLKESNNSSLEHAEMIAIKEASKKLNNWRLDGCSMYVTLDPCPMCASAIKQSRISYVYSALKNSDSKNSQLICKIFENDATNPNVFFISNIDSERSKKMLSSFFKKQRNE